MQVALQVLSVIVGVLLSLAARVMAPYAIWISDRSIPHSIRKQNKE
jgi:hypothetical protein